MKMHWVTARLNLGGQGFTIIVFDAQEPISWPEAQVLMAIHGQDSLFMIKPVATSETTPRAEKERLAVKYPKENVVERTFPGYMPRMEMLMPGEPEDQPRAKHFEANLNGNAPGPDDEDDPPQPVPQDPPAGPAVFKPGRHQPPAKGA